MLCLMSLVSPLLVFRQNFSGTVGASDGDAFGLAWTRRQLGAWQEACIIWIEGVYFSIL